MKKKQGKRGRGRKEREKEPGNISPQEIEENGLGNVIGVVASHEFVHLQESSSSIKSLATEDATESAVVFEANNVNDLVHGPSVQVLVGNNLKRELVLKVVSMNGLERVIAVAGDSLVDGQEEEMEAVIVKAVEFGEDVGKDGGILAARSTDGDALTGAEKGVVKDEVMDLGFESMEEAFPAHVL